MNTHLLIKKTAEAIQNGLKPYKLIENPQKILSGELKKIVLNRTDCGIILYEDDIKELEKNGLDTTNLEWKSKFNNKLRYVVYEQRDNTILIDAVESGLLKDYHLFDVPVEDWSYVIKFMKKQTGGKEYIEMLI